MKKTILVTGCNGFIANAFINRTGDKYNIIGIDISKNFEGFSLCREKYTIDICNSDAIRKIFENESIDVVVHTAAEKSLVVCQSAQERAHRINYVATQELYSLAKQYNAKMIFISSDQVFDGRTGNYTEDAPVLAINYYGELKIQAENMLSGDPRAAICRTALVFGEIPKGQLSYFKSIRAQRNLAVQGYIVQQTQYCLEHGLNIVLPDDEFVSPTHVTMLAEQLETVIEKDIAGILHCCGHDRISRYEMGLAIAEYYNLSPNGILKRGNENLLRPKDVSLNCEHTEQLFGYKFLSFRDALKKFM